MVERVRNGRTVAVGIVSVGCDVILCVLDRGDQADRRVGQRCGVIQRVGDLR